MLTVPEFVEYGESNPADDQWLASLWLMMCGANLHVPRPGWKKMTPKEAEELSIKLGLIDGDKNND